jgi:hypothetical protein
VVVDLDTVWTVSVASYVEDNRIYEEDVARELGGYLTSMINDLPEFENSDAWAVSQRRRPDRQADGIAVVYVYWRIEVTPAQWLAARGLPPRTSARKDLLEFLPVELYRLPSLCDTNIVMTATYKLAGRTVRREFKPENRRRAGRLKPPQ